MKGCMDYPMIVHCFKKPLLTGIAALLALAVLSCTGAPEEDHTRYTPDGRPLVELAVGTGDTGRALNDTLAAAGINFYEVAFFDGTYYYRTSWSRGRSGRLFVPAFNYAAAGNAILFAGQRADDDYTLLAVGLLTSVDGLPGADITLTTQTVTFTLVPLLTDVKADASSGFQITSPSGFETASVAAPFPLFPLNPTSPGGPPRNVPLFRIPEFNDTIEAAFALSLPGGLIFSNYQDGIYAAGPGRVENLIPLLGNPPLVEDFPNFHKLDITITSPASGGTLPNNLILFEIATPDVPYAFYSRMFFEIPVNAIENGASTDGIQPLTWHIRGGLINDVYDEGAAVNSLGGAIVLGIGAVAFHTLP